MEIQYHFVNAHILLLSFGLMVALTGAGVYAIVKAIQIVKEWRKDDS